MGYFIVVSNSLISTFSFSYFLFNPIHSYILDLTPTSKLKREFSSDEWSQLVANSYVESPNYGSEIETIIEQLFDPTGFQVRI
jgi:hypothetical protein